MFRNLRWSVWPKCTYLWGECQPVFAVGGAWCVTQSSLPPASLRLQSVDEPARQGHLAGRRDQLLGQQAAQQRLHLRLEVLLHHLNTQSVSSSFFSCSFVWVCVSQNLCQYRQNTLQLQSVWAERTKRTRLLRFFFLTEPCFELLLLSFPVPLFDRTFI